MLENPLSKKKEIKFKESKTQESSNLDSTVAMCAEELMNAATSFHKLHLKLKGTGSYAQHKALQDYDKFHDFADTLVEEFQGASGKLLIIKDSTPKTLNSVEEGINYLTELKDIITSLQDKLPYSEIINQLDTIKSTINSMKYKLTFLS